MSRFETHLFTGMHQSIFEPQNAFSGAQTGFQLLGMAWFGEVVVCSGFQAGDEILFRAF